MLKTKEIDGKMYRLEEDSIGTMWVPIDAYYGVQTMRAMENFPITGTRVNKKFIMALAIIKKAAAISNLGAGVFEKPICDAIVQACEEIYEGEFNDQFITDQIQGGAGTSFNMNANEVIANRAIEIMGGKKGDYHIVHPNDHVNNGQSTNDVIPTAGKMATLWLYEDARKQFVRLRSVLFDKSKEFDDVITMARTQMQDAVPIRLGQEFRAYMHACERCIARIDSVIDEMRYINMGGTAVGTGLNADMEYYTTIVPNLEKFACLGLKQSADLIDSTSNLDSFVAVSGAFKAMAVLLSKMSNDLRLLSSGPRCGFREINLPAKQNGSSIMPGKVNPVIPEVMTQLCFKVFGNDDTITKAAESGQLQLNMCEPVIFYSIFETIQGLGAGVATMIDNCISGITANKEHCKRLVDNSIGIITVMSPHIGYQKAAELAHVALEEDKSLRDVILQEKVLTQDEIDEILDPIKMTRPGII